jgi:hypothetical protein
MRAAESEDEYLTGTPLHDAAHEREEMQRRLSRVRRKASRSVRYAPSVRRCRDTH